MSAPADIRSWTTVDKTSWGDGPWLTEPDKMQWVDEASGLDCLIVRNTHGTGALCGYVGVPPGHPWHKVHYDAVSVPSEDDETGGYVEVHGGLTYSDMCEEGRDESLGICHVPLPGRAADVWWLGFDCAHHLDLSPARAARDAERGYPPDADETYKTIEYVQVECRRLARQAAEVTA
jgi:hypothetical protein